MTDPAAPASAESGKTPTRDLILEAAERVVAREGARRLTIDAVVRESGFSKGGVLYNFPSKQALIEGMIRRMVDHAESEHERALKDAEAAGADPLSAVVRAALRHHRLDREVSMALLAAVAESPELIDPVREALARMRSSALANASDKVLARIALLAADGLHFSDILGLETLTDQEREAVEARLADLVAEPRS